MDSVEDYARKWTGREKEEVDTLSEWVNAVRSWIQIRIRKLKRSMSTKTTSVFKDLDDAESMSIIHEKYVVISADQPPNNIILICKKHYIVCLKIELGMASSQCNHTYTATTLSKRGNH